MPRQIIDTEVSRPAYERRRTRRWVVTFLILILLVAAGWFLAHRAQGQESRAAGGSASPLYLSAQKGVPNVALTLGEKSFA